MPAPDHRALIEELRTTAPAAPAACGSASPRSPQWSRRAPRRCGSACAPRAVRARRGADRGRRAARGRGRPRRRLRVRAARKRAALKPRRRVGAAAPQYADSELHRRQCEPCLLRGDHRRRGAAQRHRAVQCGRRKAALLEARFGRKRPTARPGPRPGLPRLADRARPGRGRAPARTQQAIRLRAAGADSSSRRLRRARRPRAPRRSCSASRSAESRGRRRASRRSESWPRRTSRSATSRRSSTAYPAPARLNERIAKLQLKLAAPDLSDEQRASIEAQIAQAQRQLAEPRADREALARQASFATVGLTLTTQDAADAIPAQPGRIERAARDAASVLAP